jgi:hypothetical protein
VPRSYRQRAQPEETADQHTEAEGGVTVNASDKEKRERSLAPLVVGLVVACAVLLVVVIVLALLYFRSREPADGTPTAAVARPTEAATGTPLPTPGEDDLAAIIPATTKVLSGITIDKLISIS